MTTMMKRALYTFGAAALLLGAAPALAADAGPHEIVAGVQRTPARRAPACAKCECTHRAEARSGPKATASTQATASAGRDEAFVQQVWSAP